MKSKKCVYYLKREVTWKIWRKQAALEISQGKIWRKHRKISKMKLFESVCGTKKVKNLKDIPEKELEKAQQNIKDEVSYG